VLAFDSGLFSFRDLHLPRRLPSRQPTSLLFTLITNPKSAASKARAEPLSRLARSTHVRFLVFSRWAVQAAEVYLDDVYVGSGRRSGDEQVPLYTVEWDPKRFATGVHTIKVIVKVVFCFLVFHFL
jgi:hypothetical protein